MDTRKKIYEEASSNIIEWMNHCWRKMSAVGVETGFNAAQGGASVETSVNARRAVDMKLTLKQALLTQPVYTCQKMVVCADEGEFRLLHKP